MFAVDDEIEYYERSIYSIWDLFGQIGGVYEILEIVTMMFVNYFNDKLLLLSHVNNMNKPNASTKIQSSNDQIENNKLQLRCQNEKDKYPVSQTNKNLARKSSKNKMLPSTDQSNSLNRTKPRTSMSNK